MVLEMEPRKLSQIRALLAMGEHSGAIADALESGDEEILEEAVLPFVQKNGLSWVLPFHETVETFLAGTLFALVLNFILVGSTKILQVVVTWFDFFLGMPSRFVSTKAIDQLSDDSDETPKPAVVAFTVSKTAGESTPWSGSKRMRSSGQPAAQTTAPTSSVARSWSCSWPPAPT